MNVPTYGAAGPAISANGQHIGPGSDINNDGVMSFGCGILAPNGMVEQLTDMQRMDLGWDCGAYGINDVGTIVGSISFGPNGMPEGPQPMTSNGPGVFAVLLTPPGSLGGYAYDINNANQIVGCVDDSAGALLPTIWEGGTYHFLDIDDDLTDAPTPVASRTYALVSADEKCEAAKRAFGSFDARALSEEPRTNRGPEGTNTNGLEAAISNVLTSLHITVPADWERRRLRVPKSIVLHHAHVKERDRKWIGSVPVTSVERTLSDCIAGHVSPELVEQAFAQAKRRGLLGKEDIRRLRAERRMRNRTA